MCHPGIDCLHPGHPGSAAASGCSRRGPRSGWPAGAAAGAWVFQQIDIGEQGGGLRRPEDDLSRRRAAIVLGRCQKLAVVQASSLPETGWMLMLETAMQTLLTRSTGASERPGTSRHSAGCCRHCRHRRRSAWAVRAIRGKCFMVSRSCERNNSTPSRAAGTG